MFFLARSAHTKKTGGASMIIDCSVVVCYVHLTVVYVYIIFHVFVIGYNLYASFVISLLFNVI